MTQMTSDYDEDENNIGSTGDGEPLTHPLDRTEAKLAALQAKPDVAGLVERKVPESLTYAHLTDKQMADKVRMLLRSDLDFEPVCSGGRDRIMFLSGYCDRQARALLSLSAQLQEKEAECNAKTEVLLEAQRIAAQAQAECEGLRQDAERYRWLREHSFVTLGEVIVKPSPLYWTL